MFGEHPIEKLTPGQILADTSVAEFIKAMGISIASAQTALDLNSISQIGEYALPRPGLGPDGNKSLMQLGLSPPFYHYQHADLTVSLQMTMKVGTQDTFGISAHGEITNAEGQAVLASARTAQFTLKSLPASVTVGGTKFDAAGADIDAAAEGLAEKLRKPNGKFDQVFVSNKADAPITAKLDPANTANPIVTPGAVAFLPSATATNWIIRIASIPPTATPDVFKFTTGKEVIVIGNVASRLLYARKVVEEINKPGGVGFTARIAVDPNPTGAVDVPDTRHPFIFALFDTGSSVIKAEAMSALKDGARLIRESGKSIEIVGYADTAGDNDPNIKLGQRRANSVQKLLEHFGVAAAKITSAKSSGEEPWKSTPNSTNNSHFRRAEVHFPGNADLLIIVETASAVDLTSKPTPDRTNGTDGNGFIVAKNLDALPVNASTKIKLGAADTPVDVKGDAVPAESLIANSPEAFAFNLAAAINAGSATHHVRASRKGSVVLLAKDDDIVTIDLVLLSKETIKLSADGGAKLEKDLTDIVSGAPAVTPEGKSKITFAAGLSVDFRTSRQFEQSVNGNSTITARLVAIPAPVEFLEEIKKFLTEETP